MKRASRARRSPCCTTPATSNPLPCSAAPLSADAASPSSASTSPPQRARADQEPDARLCHRHQSDPPRPPPPSWLLQPPCAAERCGERMPARATSPPACVWPPTRRRPPKRLPQRGALVSWCPWMERSATAPACLSVSLCAIRHCCNTCRTLQYEYRNAVLTV